MIKINENLIICVLTFIAGCLIMVYNFMPVSMPEASAADNVSVTATITSSVTCGTDVQTTAFGPLALSSITNSSPDITATTSCNYAAGCNLKIYDAGNGTNPGLASTTQPTIIIGSANDSWADTATLAAGTTEGYGIYAATSTSGSGEH